MNKKGKRSSLKLRRDITFSSLKGFKFNLPRDVTGPHRGAMICSGVKDNLLVMHLYGRLKGQRVRTSHFDLKTEGLIKVN